MTTITKPADAGRQGSADRIRMTAAMRGWDSDMPAEYRRDAGPDQLDQARIELGEDAAAVGEKQRAEQHKVEQVESQRRPEGRAVGQRGVEDGAAFSIDDLFLNMLFCGKPSEFIVLDHLQINEPERKKTVKSDKPNADECAASASVPSHLRPLRFTTG